MRYSDNTWWRDALAILLAIGAGFGMGWIAWEVSVERVYRRDRIHKQITLDPWDANPRHDHRPRYVR